MQPKSLLPPVAEERPFMVLSPFGSRLDPYYWLRDDERKDPEVRQYLTRENDYADAWFAPLESCREGLYRELVGRLKQDDSTVPYCKEGVWHYIRYEAGREYPIYAARFGAPDAPEKILLDANIEAVGSEFYEVANLEVSPDGRWLAYAEDRVGRRQHTIRFRDLSTGTALADALENVESDLAWTDDGKTLFYVAKDPETLLGTRVMRHTLGTSQPADVLVHEEHDDSYYLGVERSRSGRYVFISLSSTLSSEVRYGSADGANAPFVVAIPREHGHEYQLEDYGDRFVIRTNAEATNFRVVSVPIESAADRALWRDEVVTSDAVYISDFTVLGGFLVVAERSSGLRRIHVRSWGGTQDFMIDADEPTYTMSLGVNEDPTSTILRYVYASPSTPRTTYDQDLRSGTRLLRKRDPVEGGFDPERYRTELVWAPARDGARIPISLLYRREHRHDGSAPLYLYGYGAYGLSQDPGFRSTVFSLVDRGVVYAIAHVRGGQELGRQWYDDGRLLNKKHTFEDFIDVTRHLMTLGVCDPARVCAAGGSAGGLLVGAIANLEPALYRVLVAHVPFVDIVTTMLDDSIPLTTNEYDEWGDPAADAQSYAYMLSYSPYDNVAAREYPSLYVATGLHDSQVQYWEPAKWVARLRALKTDDRPVILRTDLESGHGGKSGRFQRYREIAEEYTFVLAQLGLTSQFKPMEA